MQSITMMRKKIIHFTGSDQRKQANAAFLIGCYMVSIKLISQHISENAYGSGTLNCSWNFEITFSMITS